MNLDISRDSLRTWKRGGFAALLVVVSSMAWGQLQPGSPWPKFQRNLLNNGVGLATNTEHSVKWTFGTNSSVQSQPAISADGTIYFEDAGGNLNALDARSGVLKWSFAAGEFTGSSPAIGVDGTIYFGGHGSFYALNGSTGKVKWTYNSSGTYIDSSPAIGNDGTIYFNDGVLHALEPATGIEKWTYTNFDGAIQSSPAIGADGTLFLSQDSGMYAFDTSTGHVKWISDVDRGTAPAIGPNGDVYAGEVGGICALDPLTGDRKWFFPLANGFFCSSCPAVAPDGTVYIGTGVRNASGGYAGGYLYAIDGETGTFKWSVQTLYPIFGNPIVGSDGTVYAGWQNSEGTYGVFDALDPSTGALKWTFHPGGEVFSPAIGSDGTIYFGANTYGGPTTYPNFSFFALGQPLVSGLSVAAPTLAGGTSTTGLVTLDSNVTVSSGDVVSLKSSSAVAQVPASVTVAENSRTAKFSVTTSPVSAYTSVTLTATLGASTQTTSLTVFPGGQPTVARVSVAAATVPGGTTTTGTVTLSGNATVSPGDVVSLSSNSSVAQVPSSVTVGLNSDSAQFTVTTTPVSSNVVVTLSASLDASTKTTSFTVTTALVSSVTLSPSTIVGGFSTSCTVSLAEAAGPQGDVVSISANPRLSFPRTVLIPAGQNSVSFTVGSGPVSSTTTDEITATLGASSQSASLVLTTPLISRIAFSPPSVTGGGQITCTISLGSAVGFQGGSITLTVSGPASVPATAIVSAGASSVSFQVQTSSVAASSLVTVTATLGASTKSGTFTVTPAA
ncbi:MAG TPA: PQQ-binding-like beta-propeller repeat protein [Fimbriimonadaceae bacterium]